MGLFGRDAQTQNLRPSQEKTFTPVSNPGSATTTIAKGGKFSGDITGSSDLRVEGEFEGTVAISGSAFVAESGQVQASIRAARGMVAGQVDGNVFGDELIELEPTAVVKGDLLAPKILIREGASLQGRVEMASPISNTNGHQATQQGKKKPGHRRSKETKNAPVSPSPDTSGPKHSRS
jgi:cytoskeletal protein CcmA (bactofilin family)